MPPFVARIATVDTSIVNAIKAQTSGQIVLDYAARGLKIRTDTLADFNSVSTYLDGRGTEFYTFEPNPGQKVKYILRVSPPQQIVTRSLPG